MAPEQIDAGQPSPEEGASLPVALLILLAIIVVVVAYSIAGGTLGIGPLFAGFLVLILWTEVGDGSFRSLFSTLAAGLAAAGTGWLLRLGLAGPNGSLDWLPLLASLGTMCVILVLMLMKRARFLCNPTYFLFLTVLTVPPIRDTQSPPEIMLAMLFGAAFFGGLAAIGKGAGALKARRVARTAD